MTKPQARQQAQEMANRFDEPYAVVKSRGGYLAMHSDSAAVNGAEVVERISPVKSINPDLILAVEYGFKAAEKGWNLEMTLNEFRKV